MQRFENQDRFALYPDIGLAVVADGMGGEPAGDVAAQMAVQFVCEPFADDDVTWHLKGAPTKTDALAWLVAAIERANHCIHRAADQHPAWRGMGTTIAALLVHDGHAVVAHVGDSRVHRFRDRQLRALTEDHTVFNALVRHGLADPERRGEQAMSHHVLTRALGTHAAVEVETRLVDVVPGDVFLLSSDGLHGVVDHEELAEILTAHPHLDEAVEQLIARANHLGGPDNITAVAVRID
jgi:PPM family protein phosphatase